MQTKWLHFSLHFFLLILFAACSSSAADEELRTVVYQGVIIDADKAAQLKALASFVTDHDGYYTLMNEDVVTLENHLPAYLQKEAPDIAANLSQYKRQYIGFWRQGKPYVLINAFCDDLGMDWQNEIVDVLDGGDCFFNVEYNMAEASFARLRIHGEA